MAKTRRRAVPIDKSMVEAVASKHRIEDITVEQVLWLSRILHELSRSDAAKDFALMGGSAIVFLHRDLYRFSTDLDLDFIGNKDLGAGGKNEVIDRMKADQRRFRQIAQRLGMSLELGANTKSIAAAAALRFVQYELTFPSNYSRGTRSVELDLSYRYCHTVLDPVMRPWPIPVDGSGRTFVVQTLRAEELYAGKIIAMLEGKQVERMDFPGKIGLLYKRKVRHLYDAYLLAHDVLEDRAELDVGMLKKLVLLFGVTRIRDFAFFRGDSIVAYEEDDRRNELVPVVSHGKPLPTVREMKWTVRRFLDRHLFSYDEAEHDFMEDFSAKLFRPQKIFKPKEARRLKGMFFYKQMLEEVAPLTSSA